MRHDRGPGIAGFQVDAYFDALKSASPVDPPFAADITYGDPLTAQPLTGDAICAHVQLFKGEFEVRGVLESPTGFAVEWRQPDFGDGVDLISVDGGEIVRVRRYFDPGPGRVAAEVARSVYGSRLHWGRTVRPGAFSLTSFHLRSEYELERLADLGAEIELGMSRMDGVIAVTTFAAGDMAYSVTAWTDAHSAGQMMGQTAHREAMGAFFKEGLGWAGWTSVWVPDRLNDLWIRCQSCGKVSASERSEGTCTCGEDLPLATYW